MTIVLIRKEDYRCGYKGETTVYKGVMEIRDRGNGCIELLMVDNFTVLLNF